MSNDKGESDNTSTESRTSCTVGNDLHGSGEIPETSLSLEMDRSVKARCHNADRHVSEKSDSRVVTPEAGEQCWTSNGGGVRGGKETDQGERLSAAIGPDSEPVMALPRRSPSWVSRTSVRRPGKAVLPSAVSRQSRSCERSGKN